MTDNEKFGKLLLDITKSLKILNIVTYPDKFIK